MGEGFVDAGQWDFSQEGVEEADLVFCELDGFFLDLPYRGEEAVALEPIFGENADGAVVEDDGCFAFSDGLEELGDFDADAFEVGFAVELEPVDAGGDADLDFAGLAINFAADFDVPLASCERLDGDGKPPGNEGELGGIGVPIAIGAEAEFVE